MKEEKLTVKIELVGVEEATAKAERYVELLKEAKSLADELASMEFEIGIKQATDSSQESIIPLDEKSITKSSDLLTRSLKTL
ncbi:hypothetical protein P7D50_09705 [Enterococcus dongliensis]|uniref:hypothetical protein n=1 Tax=Enterococcus dongliensis TaxID=2559925 RepID=UPI002891D3B6|nr:hypothetical protein [Enterococcus dongliensis]MDT2648072.1 hypothetical protein [Enterococcus dongliensis]